MDLTAFPATFKGVLNSLASNFSPPTIRADIRVTCNSYHGLPIVTLVLLFWLQLGDIFLPYWGSFSYGILFEIMQPKHSFSTSMKILLNFKRLYWTSEYHRTLEIKIAEETVQSNWNLKLILYNVILFWHPTALITLVSQQVVLYWTLEDANYLFPDFEKNNGGLLLNPEAMDTLFQTPIPWTSRNLSLLTFLFG